MTIKGFITNLGKYNEGELRGEWVQFPISDEERDEVLKRIGIGEVYEEYFFTDWECEIDCGLGEYVSIDEVNELAEELENVDADIIEALLECHCSSLRDALDCVDDAIFYPGQTLEDVAYDLVNECYDLPEFALNYFDYEAFARDLSCDGYYEATSGVICVG